MPRTIDTHDFDPLTGPEDDTVVEEPVAEPVSGTIPPTKALAALLLRESTTPAQRRRITAAGSLCVVVQVPTPAWVVPLRDAMRALASWHETDVRDGSARHKRKPEEGADQVAYALARGLRVLGISHAPDALLPRCLLAGADIRITVGQPSDRVIRRAIVAATGSRPRTMPSGIAAGLDFPELVACIRLGATAAEAVLRLRRAGQARLTFDPTLTDLPHVTAIHGFGDAATWAENLLADLAEFRANRLDFNKISRTLTLSSDPGLGKTSWVRALAASAGTPLVTLSLGTIFATSGNGGYLGDIAGRISRTFAEAKSFNCPVIIFLDEIDALPSREKIDPRSRDYWLPLITLFLLEVETAACSSDSRIILIAATNHADHVDPALLRPGRLHPTIRIPRPDAAALTGIFRQHLGADLNGLDLASIASLAAGATGADVMAWVRDARRTARTAGRPMILPDLIDLIVPPDPRPEHVLWRAAVHESGHALSVWAHGAHRVTLVSIVAGHGRGGRTVASTPYDDARSRADMEAYAITALAGRAAEVAFGLDLNSGASDDLRIATQAVASLHTSMGLGGSLVHRGGIEETSQALMLDCALRKQVSADLDDLYSRALGLIEAHRVLVHRVATALMTARQLDGDAFEAIVGPRAATSSHKEPRHG